MAEDKITTASNCIEAVSEILDADIYVVSGMLERSTAYDLMNEFTQARHLSNCVLILTTYGGDPDGAYMVARFLQRSYKKFILYVCGFCKSAGTLIALGAAEIIMSWRGELGPLDVQVFKEDSIVGQNSGLDILEAINTIGSQALLLWENHFLQIINSSRGIVTTRTAADIASSLAAQLLTPITAQIDPLRLGEIQRAINIARKYGEQLGASSDTVGRLIYSYPSHGFVIDIDEAGLLFQNVRLPTDDELALEQILQKQMLESYSEECIWRPHSKGVVVCLTKSAPKQNEEENTHEGAAEEDIYIASPAPNGTGKSNDEAQLSPGAEHGGKRCQEDTCSAKSDDST